MHVIYFLILFLFFRSGVVNKNICSSYVQTRSEQLYVNGAINVHSYGSTGVVTFGFADASIRYHMIYMVIILSEGDIDRNGSDSYRNTPA